MKKINRSFYFTIIATLAVVAGTVYLFFILLKKYPDNGYVYGLLFLVLFLFLFLFTYVQVVTESLIIRKNNYLIRENQEPPKDIKNAFNKKLFKKKVLDKGFIVHSEQPAFTVLYICDKDHIKKIFRHHLLQVVVIINEKENEFYLEELDEEIEKLKDNMYKAKKRPTSILISQYKIVARVTPNVKDQINENILLKNKYGIYSVINIALDRTSGKAVFLHSIKFSPSLYYKYQVEQILEFI